MKRRLLGNKEEVITYSYTVYYNVNGATVYADGEEVGVISNGSLTFYKTGDEAKSSYAITFSGTLTTPSSSYTFSVNPTSLSFTASGGTQSVAVTSTVTTYTVSHASGTVNADSSVSLTYNTTSSTSTVSYSASASGTGLSVSGTNITFASNSAYSTRSGTVTYTQSTSGNTATVTCTQAANTTYTYTVYTNCTGGTVYFNGTSMGTISSSTFTFTSTSSSGTVSISGGVPSSTTSYGTSTTEYEYSTRTYTESTSGTSWNRSVSPSSMSFTWEGGTQTATITCQYNPYTATRTVTQPTQRSRTATPYTTYTYTAPSAQTCQGNGSVTMNYTSSTTTGTTYGSWSDYSDYGSASYGSWSYSYEGWTNYSNVYVYSTPDMVSSASISNYVITVTVDASTSARSGNISIFTGAGTTSLSLTQTAPSADDYTFYLSSGTTATVASNSDGTTRSEDEFYSPVAGNWVGFSCISGLGVTSGTTDGIPVPGGTIVASGSSYTYVDTYPEGVYDYWGTGTCSHTILYKWNANNNNYYGRGPVTVTATQAGSGKQLTITNIIQLALEFNCGYYGNYSSEYTPDTYSADGGTLTWRGCYKWHYPDPEDSYSGLGFDMPSGGTWSVTTCPSWIVAQGKTSGDMDDNNTSVYFTVQANNTITARSSQFILTETLMSKTATWNITQEGQPNEFYVTNTDFLYGYVIFALGTTISASVYTSAQYYIGQGSTGLINVVVAADGTTLTSPFGASDTSVGLYYFIRNSLGSYYQFGYVTVTPGGGPYQIIA